MLTKFKIRFSLYDLTYSYFQKFLNVNFRMGLYNFFLFCLIEFKAFCESLVFFLRGYVTLINEKMLNAKKIAFFLFYNLNFGLKKEFLRKSSHIFLNKQKNNFFVFGVVNKSITTLEVNLLSYYSRIT